MSSLSSRFREGVLDYFLTLKNPFFRETARPGANTFFDPQALKLIPNTVKAIRHSSRNLRRALPGSGGIRAWEYGVFAAHVPLAGRSLLDVGCGRSWFGFYCASQGAQVRLFDLPDSFEASDKFARVAQRRRIPFDRGRMTHLPYPDHSFDIVLCVSAIEHLHQRSDDPDRCVPHKEFLALTLTALQQMARVLKPGGLLYLTTDFFDPKRQFTDAWTGTKKNGEVWCAYRIEELHSLFLPTLEKTALKFAAEPDLRPSLISTPGRNNYRGRHISTANLLLEKSRQTPPAKT